MTTPCCKLFVVDELGRQGYVITGIKSIEFTVKGIITDEKLATLKAILIKNGLDLIVDKDSILVEKIKKLIIDKIHTSENTTEKIVFSVFLHDELDMDYSYMSDVYSKEEHETIEHFTICHRLDRVKEELVYDELSISEISYKFNYSSVGHLSNQFRTIMGMTPTFYKKLRIENYELRIEKKS